MTQEASVQELLLAGLQATGKTSFLALFYLSLLNGEGALKLASFQDDREHLNNISKRLMECETPRRTEVAEHGRMSLSLEEKSSKARVALNIPDLSGEIWGEAVEERLWTVDMEDQVRESDAVLLFVSADRVDAGVTKGEADDTAAALGAEPAKWEPGEDAPETKQVMMEGNPPTQVQIVDLLQLTVEQRGTRPAKAGIILSAWDTQPESVTPGEFVEESMPLLSQYLAANAAWLSVRIFGVSAQGGSFEDQATREGLANESPLARAFVVAGDGSSAPIGAPIEWALDINQP